MKSKTILNHKSIINLSRWVTPFTKQCFVTTGVSLNLAAQGLVAGFAAILIPQLREPDSTIPVDDSSGSWIAAIIGFTLIIGNLSAPTLMTNFGRKTANLISTFPMMIGWVAIVLANSIYILLAARFLQGIAMGMSASIGPPLIGEYCSPRNRGAFLTTISVALGGGVLGAHTLGSYLTWRKTAMICCCIALIDMIIVYFSPESPSWLADQGKYEESKKVFRWLRGDSEEEDLKQIIDASVALKESKEKLVPCESCTGKIQENLKYLGRSLKKKQFWKPVLIMFHLHTIGQWSGSSILASYAVDVFHHVIGKGADVGLLIVTLDTQRIISNICAIYVIKRVRRKIMLYVTVGMNVLSLLAIAGYTYAKANDMLSFDHPLIGIVLIHINMWTIASGTIPLPFIIAGELFPLEYRSLAGGFSGLFFSINIFVTIKTVPFSLNSLGIYGTFLIYAAIVFYCLVVTALLLPETKDKTLQDIEEELKGQKKTSKQSTSV